MILIITGVSGAGKSTVGRLLASRLGWRFYDADDFHPAQNIEKMRSGAPLSDADRKPWLESLRDLIRGERAPMVLACSALKQSYRDFLKDGRDDVVFVYLKTEKELARRRLAERKEHFAGPGILDDQFLTLEEPAGAVTEDASQGPESIAENIIQRLGLSA